ncbi:hypothetical protein SD70_30150 [Gordoniibacillus kamchatkensis]|uniref:DUF4190 domain-containing protein n=1 Tax=Gordoniibacillus kamchatkensis TaxID=1590651 RepID=A0ABR5AA26_9BACL|nr:hypothetical protein SD70_30150 [Paenibacillus sp. VKM B-2647]
MAITFIVAAAIVYSVVKRTRDDEYNQDSGQRAATYSIVGMLAFPLFIILGISIILIVMFYHSS